MSRDDFYRAFEDRHRGSRDFIKQRLRVYQPFLGPLQELFPTWEGIDLGCGRGEWLELLAELGCRMRGVDLDEGMLSACLARGLPAERKEALSFLRELPSESQALVSGFHLVEHIEFEALRDLASESLRVLKPGGLLILETPNPENLVVGTANFYLDPTHRRPIPPELLSFVAEFCGFCRVKILRLHEPEALLADQNVRLLDVLGGVSPDYAIVAQKAAPPGMIARFDTVFDGQYGLTLEDLAVRQAAAIDARLSALASQMDELIGRSHQAVETAERAALDARKAESAADRAKATAEHARAELEAVFRSRSWRLTAPFRGVMDMVRGRGFARSAKSFLLFAADRFKLLALRVATRARAEIIRSPHLYALARTVNARFPWIRRSLQALLRNPSDRSLARARGVYVSTDTTPRRVVRILTDLRRQPNARSDASGQNE